VANAGFQHVSTVRFTGSPAWKSIGAPAIVSVLTRSGFSAAYTVASHRPWQSSTKFRGPPMFCPGVSGIRCRILRVFDRDSPGQRPTTPGNEPSSRCCAIDIGLDNGTTEDFKQARPGRRGHSGRLWAQVTARRPAREALAH